ncbi:permease for cytosine/purines, uracil, thiamine, allantoin-domain-containing protein [Aspergillus coremiiformis]|uniref:Permease for cytosine/purines, uracil, thiamine, allantoin-domain-containing protein n=1 Tax=Aspergillus coremiiformis TaxID=138285 RepID=A0A5N6Z8X0_9EURO|nr:permease for cytosine/purines, uracil, thiamine, allantoin-domain-containing protein [Aspergillus coremiiformis]
MLKMLRDVRETVKLAPVDGEMEYTQWVNEDLLPTPLPKQTWRAWNYITFYWSLSFTNWTLGSTMIGGGLSWWQSIMVIFISQCISSIAMAFNSRVASVYHIGFPCVARSVFGMWGSYYFVGARAAIAVVWYALQRKWLPESGIKGAVLTGVVYFGAQYMNNILRAIFGHQFRDLPNRLPQSAGITTSLMLAFLLCWLIHLPFCHFRPYQLRKFFWFKAIVSLLAMFGLFIWAMADTNGHVGGLNSSSSRSASSTTWLILAGINSGLGNTATLITNQPDFARWASNRRAPVWTQLIVNPIAVTVSASLGILSTNAVNVKYGTDIWNQWDMLNLILDQYWCPKTRFAVFLCAFAWLVQIVGTNIAANLISFGSDAAMLFPRYLNMRRGQYLAQFLAWAVCPWKILASAATFQTFLSGYGLFMAGVVAIMIADCKSLRARSGFGGPSLTVADFCLTKGNVFIASLYIGTPANQNYYYHGGWNRQAMIAYIVGLALPFPGFCGTLGARVSASAAQMMDLAWILSFTVSFVLYMFICSVWPTRHMRMVKERGYTFEQVAPDRVSERSATSLGEGLDRDEGIATGTET